MAESWKARQMEPGVDTIRVMATHYGYTPSMLKEAIMRAGAKVIREDGFRGTLSMAKSMGRRQNIVVWNDGQVVDPTTTKLTRSSIKAVANWAFEKMYGDN